MSSHVGAREGSDNTPVCPSVKALRDYDLDAKKLSSRRVLLRARSVQSLLLRVCNREHGVSDELQNAGCPHEQSLGLLAASRDDDEVGMLLGAGGGRAQQALL